MIKQTVLAAAIALAPVASMASDNCANWQSLAENVMEGRQSGVRMSDMMNVPKQEDGAQFKSTFRAMVADAYAEPRFSTPKYQQRSIRKFGNAVYRYCYSQ